MDEDARQAEVDELAHEGAETSRVGALEFKRAKDGAEGSFHMTAATNGEASDGHILNIAGAQYPDRVPLLLGHMATDEIPALGHATDFRKARGNPARLRARGQFNLTGGEGDGLLPRRVGVWNLVKSGDLGSVSVRWSSIKATPRVNLPKSHPAHVAGDEPDFMKRTGLYYDKWMVREQSVVAVGADPAALIGRAAELGPEVEALIRSLDLPGRNALEVATDALRDALETVTREGGDLAAVLANLIGEQERDEAPLVRYTYLDGETVREHWLPQGALDALRGHSPKVLSAVLASIDDLGERMTQLEVVASRPAPVPAPVKPARERAPAPQVRKATDLSRSELSEIVARVAGKAIDARMREHSIGKVRR